MSDVLIGKRINPRDGHTQEKAMGRHSEKAPTYKPRREASGETKSAHTLRCLASRTMRMQIYIEM